MIILFILIANAFLLSNPICAETHYPKTMVLVSDSRGLGVFADTSMKSRVNLKQKLQMELVGYVLRAAEQKLHSIPMENWRTVDQDSFKKRNILENFTLNAFTGNQIYSHKSRIEKVIGQEVLAINTSVGAGTSYNIVSLVNYGTRQAKKSQKKIDYWVIDLGAVDYIWNVPLEILIKNYQKGIVKILDHNKDARILITTIPPMMDILKFSDHLGYRFIGHESCEQVWKRLNIATSLLELTDEDLLKRHENYEKAIYEVAADFPEANIKVAKYPRINLGFKGLAADCWHPNKLGNQAISNATWGVALDLFETD